MFIWCAHFYSFAFTFTWFCGLANNPPTKAKLWRLDWHMVPLTLAVAFDMLMISLEPWIYGFHIFVSSTWLTEVIFDLLGNTHLLFIFTALQIWHGFKSLAVGVTCSKNTHLWAIVKLIRLWTIVILICVLQVLLPNHKFTLSQQIEKEAKARKKE